MIKEAVAFLLTTCLIALVCGAIFSGLFLGFKPLAATSRTFQYAKLAAVALPVSLFALLGLVLVLKKRQS